jgi:hypothetical protein
MGFYERSRYRKGLSGDKPGWIVLDEKGHRAQEAGYRDHLRNRDLADQSAVRMKLKVTVAVMRGRRQNRLHQD